MSQRTLKVAASVRNTLLEILPVTTKLWLEAGCEITDVAVTSDLSLAKVYVNCTKSEVSDVLPKLNMCGKTIMKKISDINNLRRAIKVRFLEDESYAHQRECEIISKLLEEDESV